MRVPAEWVELIKGIRWRLRTTNDEERLRIIEIFYIPSLERYHLEFGANYIIAGYLSLEDAKRRAHQLLNVEEEPRPRFAVEMVTPDGWAAVYAKEAGTDLAFMLKTYGNDISKAGCRLVELRPDGSRWVMELPPTEPS